MQSVVSNVVSGQFVKWSVGGMKLRRSIISMTSAPLFWRTGLLLIRIWLREQLSTLRDNQQKEFKACYNECHVHAKRWLTYPRGLLISERFITLKFASYIPNRAIGEMLLRKVQLNNDIGIMEALKMAKGYEKSGMKQANNYGDVIS
jgi:hypothetical protein